MKKQFSYLGILGIMILGASCVSQKKYMEAENTISSLEKKNSDLNDDIKNLTERLYLMEDANNSAATELSSKDSLLLAKGEVLENQQKQLLELQAMIERQKQQTKDLHQKMLNALGGFKSEDLYVYTKNNKVYVSMSEKLLFPSGSAVVNKDGKEALGKIAQALNENQDVNVTVEGHTDSIPIKIRFEDNWALSVARSNSIIRILVNDYSLNPQRLTASGRAEFEPVADNGTLEGRAKNRRTEIVLAPKLDELFELMKSQ